MTPAAFDKACLALPGAALSVQWGGSHVFKIGGKMFAIRSGAATQDGIAFKASDLAFEVLTQTGRARPARYLARAKWVGFSDLSALDDEEVADWLRNAHGLVAAKLTRQTRAALGLSAPPRRA